MAGAGTPGREGTPMLTVVPDVAGALPAGEPSSLIDQIVRDGARQMLAAALQAEVAAYIDQFAGLRDENGRRMVVRNGTAEPRTVLTSAGAVEVTAPRVNDKRADPATGEALVTIVGAVNHRACCPGCHPHDPVQVFGFVERDEGRAVGDDQVLARAADLADEAALHSGFQVDGGLVEDRDPARAAVQERAEDERFLYAGAGQFDQSLAVLSGDCRLDDHGGLVLV